MKWTDTQRIAEELYDLHGDTIDPKTLRFTQLRDMILALPEFDDDPARCAEEFWPATGERIRVCRLGTWPDGELRLTRRECFLSMVERPQFQRLRAQRPARTRGSAEEPSDRRTPELG